MTTAGAPSRPVARPAPRTATALDPRAAVRASQDTRFRRSVTLLVLTLLLPGTAQLVRGNRTLGRIVLLTWVAALLAAGAYVGLGGTGAVASVAVSPHELGLLRLAALGLALAWVLLLLDAWRLGEPPRLRRGHRIAMTATAAALATAVTLPLVLVAHYASVQRDLVSTLFGSGAAAEASDGRINLLLLGGDAATGRPGLRTDSMNLVSVDVTTGRTVLVGMPRNFEDARFPAGTPLARAFPDGFHGDGEKSQWLLNAVYLYGTDHPDLVPGAKDPGAEAIKQAVAGTLGMTVHYYLLVNLGGFRDVVDALGGVTLTVEEDVPYGQSGGVLEAGTRHLGGREALWYARSRTGSSDYVRMHRQRCVLGALLHEADPVTVLRRFSALAGSAKGVITTDLPQAALPRFVELAVSARSQGIASLQMSPPLVQPGNPDLVAMRAALARVLHPGASASASNTQDQPAQAEAVARPPGNAASAARAAKAAPAAPAAAGSPVGDVRAAGGASKVEQSCGPSPS